MLKNEKSASRNEHRNRSLLAQKPKNRSKNSQNRKTENPNVPLRKLRLALPKCDLQDFYDFDPC